MKKEILLGYEIGTGEKVFVRPSHLVVTGVTQLSGKTTTLEALIKRSGKKAIVFRTKIGEKSFVTGTMIPPFFKDKSDWQFIQSLIEATMKEKMRMWDRSKIIQLSKGTNGLLEFKKKVDDKLLEPKLRGFDKDILTNLQAYLEIVLPKLQSINFSNTLELTSGVNIINMERFSRDVEVQSLIIRSVIEEVLYNFKNIIIVIPEAWKFIPQSLGNPCKRVVEEFIRQGATNENYMWFDSQDLAGTDKIALKQVSTWILGYQSEINEVKHTLAQIPLPKGLKPKPEDIQSLGIGEFYYVTNKFTKKIYVLPSWLDAKIGKKIALGKIKVDEIDKPESLAPFSIKTPKIDEKGGIDLREVDKKINKELNEMRSDFFDKIEDVQQQINELGSKIYNIKTSQPMIDEDTIVAKVLQKVKIPKGEIGTIDIDPIIQQVLQKIPKQIGTQIFEVAPLEKIQKNFLQEAKDKIMNDINTLSDNDKKALKYIESSGVGRDVANSELITKCFHLKAGGSSSTKISVILKRLRVIEVVEKTAGGRSSPRLKQRIRELLEVHNTTEEEIQQVYDHILNEMI